MHRTQTVVRHWINLDERERFEFRGYNGTTRYRAVDLYAEVTDGSLSSAKIASRRILKSGSLGVYHDVRIWPGHPQAGQVYAILRARGVKTPERAS